MHKMNDAQWSAIFLAARSLNCKQDTTDVSEDYFSLPGFIVDTRFASKAKVS